MNSDYLPYVNPEVGYSLAKALDNADDEEYMEAELTRIDEENPAVSTWIRHYAERTDDSIGAKFCSLYVYKLLESQAEANRMAKEITL